MGLDYGEAVTMEMTEAITEYLMNGGYIYAECGTFFGGMAYIGFPNHEELMELFSVEETEYPLTQNSINLLSGQPGSICEGLEFTGSYQIPVWFIDKMTPSENGVAAFEEEEYGTVAVQGEGEYGQKTFCFSYALAKLLDGDEGTREELLTRIAEFFDLISTGETEITSKNVDINITIYPSPFSENTKLSYSVPNKSFVNIEIYTINGRHISTPVHKFQQEGKHEVMVNGTILPSGVYFCRLQIGKEVVTKKIIKL